MSRLMRGSGSVTYAKDQGPRSYQEDRELVIESTGRDNYVLLAVADGHAGGPQVAQFAVTHLHRIFAGQRKLPIKERIGMTLYELGKLTADMRQGSTLSAVHIEDDVAHVAHIGDSPIIIIDENGSMIVSEDHNARSNPRELESACERGGKYSGGYLHALSGAGLQLTRSLGDSEMGSVIKREPDTCSFRLGPKSLVIICSDGLIDPGHGSETEALVRQVVRKVQAGAEAQDLLAWAKKRCLQDNATVIVYRHQ